MAESLPWIAPALPADGLAVHWKGEWSTHGLVPDADGLARAMAWAQAQASGASAWTAVGADWDAPEATLACGVGGLRLSPVGDNWLLVFRREQRETIRWAGRPEKALHIDRDGLKVGPRTSFAAWESQVDGSAVPWSEDDRHTIERVRMLLQRSFPLAPVAVAHIPPADVEGAWEVLDRVRRLKRVVALLEESGTQLAPDYLRSVDELIVRLESDTVEAAGLGGASVAFPSGIQSPDGRPERGKGAGDISSAVVKQVGA